MRILTLILSLLCINAFAKISPEKIAYVEEIKQRAAKGDADAQNNLGSAYYNSDGLPKDYAEAVKWWRKSAEQGNADAQYNLGLAYYLGNGVTKDREQAEKWYQKSADQGNALGQYGLGNCYLYGNLGDLWTSDVDNRLTAMKWYQKSAEQDYMPAQYNLAGLCETYVSEIEGAKWYLKAARQGSVAAQYKMGLAYQSGKGVPKDIIDSYAYFYLAANKNGDAAFELQNLEAKISSNDKYEGRQRAKELEKEIAENIAAIKRKRGW